MADQSNNGKTPPKRPPQPLTAAVAKTPPLSVQHHLQSLKPLVPSKVRWFYQEEKKWIAFCGADSLKIEEVFKLLPVELQSPLLIPSNYDPTKLTYPTVKGSLYEVDILGREIRPIYWKENAVSIMRGTWFKGSIAGNWEPIEEKDAQRIEDEHLKVVRSLGLGSPLDNHNNSSPANSNAIHAIKIGVNRIEWHDISDIYMISESAGSRLAQKIGLSGATELHRGYEEDCEINDELAPINHIVFLVHGMGQLYHGEGGIVHSRKKFTDVIQKADNRFFKEMKKNLEGRVEFFPIEWRTKLKLDEGMIEKITPANLGSLRKVINDTTLDVFYYTSPFYREEIIQAMRKELNHVYKSYITNNPAFAANRGKVSIIAHSLGSVIIHDVLTLWNSNLMKEHQKDADVRVASASSERLFTWFWGWGQEKGEKAPSSLSLCSEDELKAHLHEARLKIAKIEMKTGAASGNSASVESSKDNDIDCYSLEFKVENVFNIGSPLGMFLVMRGIRPRNDIEQHILPTSVCNKTFNIYDPVDPVAYRLEPLIYDYYSDIPPVRLSHVGVKRKPTPKTHEGGASGWLKGFFSSKSNKTDDPISFKNEEGEVDLPKSTDEKTQEILEGKKVMDNRLDYVLEQSMVEYFSAITSHQAYWHTLDFARFVLYHLYDMAEKESLEPSPASSSEDSSKL